MKATSGTPAEAANFADVVLFAPTFWLVQEAIGRSKGRLSTKIHATCDALGNPTGFHLTVGKAHDLEGADALIENIEADEFLADKAYDADERLRIRCM